MTKVLLVEDHHVLSEVLKHALINRGFTVQAVRNRYAALETVSAHVKLLGKSIANPGCPSLIETERHRGYRLISPDMRD